MRYTVRPWHIPKWVEDTKKASAGTHAVWKSLELALLILHPGLSVPSPIPCELTIPPNDGDLPGQAEESLLA